MVFDLFFIALFTEILVIDVMVLLAIFIALIKAAREFRQ